MMQAFGLPLPERRIGLSAHDFCQAFSAPEVWLTRARRKEGAPTVPCRWLLRLRARVARQRLGGAKARTQAQTAALAAAAGCARGDRLRSAAAAAARRSPPGRASSSVTQIETWMRDPYAIYARHILRLRALEPLDAEPEAADFGTFVHAALGAVLTGSTDRFSAGRL